MENSVGVESGGVSCVPGLGGKRHFFQGVSETCNRDGCPLVGEST